MAGYAISLAKKLFGGKRASRIPSGYGKAKRYGSKYRSIGKKVAQSRFNPRFFSGLSGLEHPVIKHLVSANNALGSGYTGMYINWGLNDLPEDSNYKVLYSLFRIEKVVVEIFLDSTVSEQIAGGTNAVPYVMSSIDDSGNLVAGTTTPTLQEISDYSTFKFTPANSAGQSHLRVIYPKYTVDSKMPTNDFCRTGDDTENWHGLLIGFITPNVYCTYTIHTTLYYKFKNQH